MLIQDTDKLGDESIVANFGAHNNAIFDVAWMPYNTGHVVTASGDQSVRLWNIISDDEVALIRKFRGYTRSVKCVEFAPENPSLIATGSRENTILLWDIREPSETKPALAIKGAHTHSSSGGPSGSKGSAKKSIASSVTAIKFQDDHHIVSSSDTDGILKVWDLRRSYDRFKGEPQANHCIPYPGKSALHGYSSLVMNSAKTCIYASCKDNQIYAFDLASYSEKPLATYGGYENGCKYFIRMSLSCDDKYLACGSSDQYAYIWNTSVYAPKSPVYRITGHDSEVTCVEWSKSGWRLATCSDDMNHRIWRVCGEIENDKEQTFGEAEKMENARYATKLSFKVSNFFDKEDENIENNDSASGINLPQPKKRRIRSPLTSLPTTPQKNAVKFAQFPCSLSSKSVMSPRKVVGSPRKLILSPRKFMSPTANLPNLVADGRSPHQPNSGSKTSSKKKARVDWLTSFRQMQRMQVVKGTNNAEEVKEGGKKQQRKTLTPKRGIRAKKSLDMGP